MDFSERSRKFELSCFISVNTRSQTKKMDELMKMLKETEANQEELKASFSQKQQEPQGCWT